ncbi:uncharacterized protein [Ambystoma mexicanum]|uniref:uncharacterized protein isoform X2 n=1 Tax=Ambystoma mexicanum TaxID=8296 RepID=UPI0037E97364
MAWDARTVLITGCNRGIGLELVRQLLAKPSAPKKIFATCRNPDSPQCQTLNDLAAKHCNLVVVKLEVTDDKSAKEAAEEVEKHLNGAGLNVLINNAGIRHPSSLETADAKDMLDVYDTNVVTPLLEAKTLNELAENLAVIKLEVTDDKSTKKVAEEVENHLEGAGLNLLINNARIRHPSSLETANAKDMLDVYATNVIGPLLVAKAFLPLLKKSAKENAGASMGCGKAALVNMSTMLGSVEKNHLSFGFVPLLSYRCSKAALNMLTNCQSNGYKADGIMCTALHPGWVKTDLGGPRE